MAEIGQVSIKCNRKDFLPKVVLDKMINCGKENKENIRLLFDQEVYVVPNVILEKNITEVYLKVVQVCDPFGPQDNDGVVEFSCSNTKVMINPPSKYVSYGDKIIVEIKHSLSWGEKFVIEVMGKDDNDDYYPSNRVAMAGKLNFRVVDKDVFTKREYEKMTKEFKFIKPFTDPPRADRLPEYRYNYCMSAAERALSKLLDNKVNFYSVDPKHKRLNKIGFSGKGAKDRGENFQSLGYVESFHIFSGYTIDHSLRKKTKNKSDYKNNKYNVIKSSADNKLYEYFKKKTLGRIGYHIYYMSITNDFHTLILVIDNNNLCDQKYAIYDQHGPTSSFGNFNDIENGIAKQTSWTFLNDYMNRGFIPSKYGKVTTRLWKIQRK